MKLKNKGVRCALKIKVNNKRRKENRRETKIVLIGELIINQLFFS